MYVLKDGFTYQRIERETRSVNFGLEGKEPNERVRLFLFVISVASYLFVVRFDPAPNVMNGNVHEAVGGAFESELNPFGPRRKC